MAIALTGDTPANTYGDLLHFNENNFGLSKSETGLSTLYDGLGTHLPLAIGSTGVNIVSGVYISGQKMTATAAELNKLDRTNSDGEAEANKAVVYSSTTGISMEYGELSNPRLKSYSESISDIGNSTTNITINLNNANTFKTVLTGNPEEFNINNIPGSGQIVPFTLIVRQDSTGNRSFQWPGSFRWNNQEEQVPTTGAYTESIFNFFTYDGGTSWNAFLSASGII